MARNKYCEKFGVAIAMKILVIQNSVRDPIGLLGDQLVQLGAELSTWLPEQQLMSPNGDFSGLIILGGHMNAHEDAQYPHLKQVVELIHQFHAENKPIMGVCLGAQLIARAFGSQVYPHSKPELGFSPLRVVEALAPELWLQNCPLDLHIMQWHFDTFDLPVQATLLMTNDLCAHQAYRIGTNIYGFQFHLEVTPDIITDWLTAKSEWIETNYPQLDQQIQTQIQAHAEGAATFAAQVAQDWSALCLDANPTQKIVSV
ncbi:type 1 glutamine amidotransferase [Leptothoe sp. PORK10 BA2]|uniref:type 1 glutamine amidotransferase n=1 Tax=Leptothoe sp. PORK10 BA2 TaxID=3110254 RepID=UPI002B213E98|nr:type 1 glutamine amidotransferase [Leptothoe sp. PORK10 BA2]MEA5463755.1 type 1 glutamine amidotransferase [Leptothoe sp. PORK10 BA2]